MIIPVIFPSAAVFWLNSNPMTGRKGLSLTDRILTDLPSGYELETRICQLQEAGNLFHGAFPISVLSPPERRCFHDNEWVKAVRHPSCLPADGFIRLRNHIYISSPEQTFLQAARKLSLEELILFGTELCGLYVYDDNSEFGQRQRQAITSPESIKQFINDADFCYGHKNARRAVSYLTGRTNSRMESMLAVLSRLSASMGGYALKRPEMNQKINLTSEGLSITEGRQCYGDMVWEEEKIIVEYDSDLAHLSSSQHQKDKNRASAISVSGYRLISLTKKNVSSITELDKTFRLLRKALGMRSIDTKLKQYEQKRMELIRTFWNFHSNFPV